MFEAILSTDVVFHPISCITRPVRCLGKGVMGVLLTQRDRAPSVSR
jgi:hypothetical protein